MRNLRIDQVKRVICKSATCAAWTLAIAGASSPAVAAQPAPRDTAPATAPTTKPVSVPIDTTTPRGTMKMLLSAISKGDGEGIRKVIYVATPVEQKMVDALVNRSTADNSFRQAVVKQFGAQAAKGLVGDPEETNAMNMEQVDKSQEKIDGDSASINTGEGGDPEPVKLKKVDGAWRIPASEFAKETDPAGVQQRIDDMNFATDLMTQYAGDVSSGKFKTAEEAGEEIKKQMMVAMMKHSAAHNAPTTGPGAAPATEPTKASQ